MRRRLLPLAATLCVALAACGGAVTQPSSSVVAATTTTAMTTTSATETTPPPPPSTTPALQGPRYGGIVVIADDQSPPTLNPYASGGDNFIVAIVGQALHTGVWDIDPATLEQIPEVVVELPTVANGGVTVNNDGTMTVHYTIRDEAVWADGTPISGEDFAFTYSSVAELAAAGEHYGAYDAYGLIDPATLAIGDKTFSCTMTQPTLAHEDLFRWLIPRHQVEGTDLRADWNEVPWFSGGPFVFDSWDRGASDGFTAGPGSISLVRNPNYWKTHPETGDPLPYLDGVEFRFIPETEQIVAAFAGREVDVIQPPPASATIEKLLGLDGADVRVLNGPVWEHLSFQFGPNNRNPDTLNGNVDFRRAVAHAIDREALMRDARGGYGEQPLASYLDAFAPDLSTQAWNRYAYSPDKAKELLAGVCAELNRDCEADPPTLIFSTTSNADMRPRLANSLVDHLAEVGIDVELQLEDSQLFFGDTLDQGTWDLGEWAWVGSPSLQDVVAIHEVFDPDAPAPDGSNYSRWGAVPDEHTARFAAIVDEMQATVDEDVLVPLLQEAEAILADQVVIIPLFSRLVVGAVWADEIAGVHVNPQASHTWNIEEWYRVDR